MAAKRILVVISPTIDGVGAMSQAQRFAFEGADELVFRPGTSEVEEAWLVQISRWRHHVDLAVGVRVEACRQALQLGMDRVFPSALSRVEGGLAMHAGSARIGVYVTERPLGGVEALLDDLRRAGAGEVVAPSDVWRGAALAGLESAGMALHAHGLPLAADLSSEQVEEAADFLLAGWDAVWVPAEAFPLPGSFQRFRLGLLEQGVRLRA